MSAMPEMSVASYVLLTALLLAALASLVAGLRSVGRRIAPGKAFFATPLTARQLLER